MVLTLKERLNHLASIFIDQLSVHDSARYTPLRRFKLPNCNVAWSFGTIPGLQKSLKTFFRSLNLADGARKTVRTAKARKAKVRKL